MLLILIFSILIFLLTVLLFCFVRNFSYWTHYPQIPSVKGRILSGNIIDFLRFKTSFAYHLRSIYNDDKYQNASVVGIYGLYQPCLLIREPELIKSIFIKDFNSFSSRPCRSDVRHDPLGALNLVFARYTYWREVRLKLSPIFSAAKLKSMYPLVQNVGKNLENYISKQGLCFKLELRQLFGRYVTDTITTTILGIVSNAIENAKDVMYLEAIKFTHFNLIRALEFLVLFFAPKLNRLLRPRVFYRSTENFMRRFIKYIIMEREKTGAKRHDLIDVFVKMKQEAEINGGNVLHCFESMTAQACVLVGGAFDASTNTIANSLLELAKDQEVQQKLRAEILQAFLCENGEISYDSLNKMEYIQMVIDETLRLYPVLPILERMYELPTNKSEDFTLQPFYDYKLRSEMPVYVSVFGLHYDPKYWPNPTKFYPERFSPANKKHITPMTYLPFGEGPHKCIGSRLGLLKVKIGLAYLLKNHYIRVCQETIINPEFDPKATVLKLKGDMYVEISYQQNVGKTKTTTDLTFCIQNHTMSNTLQTFWHQANSDCELESKRLIGLYGQFMSQTNREEDQCSSLLKHQIRKKIIQIMSPQLEEALLMSALQTNRELKQDLKYLYETDKRVSQIIWERSINEVYLFIETKELINEISLINEEEIQLVALQSILNKYLVENQQQTEILMPLLTFQITALYKKRISAGSLAKRLECFYIKLPKDLRLLYESSKQATGLLNYHHSEYLYAPRDNGPDNDRRLALTWSETKNSTDSDGHLEISFNDKGLVAFGSRYEASLKYLYADIEHQAAYFWIGTGLKPSQWWQVIWPYDVFSRKTPDHVIFKNDDTHELLCATTPYDENRRYATLLSAEENMNNPACFWLVNRF